jgi:DNA sulfur modification protein DndD
MLFRELVLENFGSYLGKNTLNLLPEDFQGGVDETPISRPIILIGGMNGGGKTTIMDALRLALYGSRAQCSTRGSLSYGDFLSQCVSSQIAPTEKTRIELAFQVAEDDDLLDIRIVRYWERNPRDGKDTLGILVNDWADKSLLNTWDEYIENLLPLGISNLFLFDGEQVKELAEQETPPVGVFDAIQSLLGLELAERLAIDLDTLVAKKRRELASSEQLAAMEEMELKLKELKFELTELEESEVLLKDKLVVAIDREEQSFQKFVQEGGKFAAEGNKLTITYKAVENEVEQYRQGIRQLAAGSLPLGLIEPLLTQVRSQCAIELQQDRGTVALEILVDRDNRLLAYLQQQSFLKTHLDEIKAFLDTENQRLTAESNSAQPTWLDADVDAIDKLDTILKYEHHRDLAHFDELQTKVTKLDEELEFLDRQIASAASPEEYTRLKEQEAEARSIVVELKAEQIATTRHLEELKRTISNTDRQLATYTEKNIKLTNDRHIIDSVTKVKETLEIFKERLTLKKINKLENEVTECFRYLLHKSELVQRVTIDAATFTLSLHDRQGQLLPKHRLSAGEKQLLAIALLWGLARVSGRQLPIAIDTPLGRLDSSHRTNLLERYFPAASEQVILLSTDTEIGKSEVAKLREQNAIAREYILDHDANLQRTQIRDGYFWE